MPNAYEFSYGNVIFEEPDGTPIFETADDLGLWLCEDSEPSPDPKWVRVDVPGADGSVDLSRALTGQVQYERRSIAMRFAGKEADHATALALVHSMRRALHGARVRMTTMLTAQVNGYYIADCECDGIAYASGDVEVTVNATADPFIRIGTQTLVVGGSWHKTTATGAIIPASVLLPAWEDSFAESTFSLSLPQYVRQPSQAPSSTNYQPAGAATGRLWWARGNNLLDASMWPVAQTGGTFGFIRQGQRIGVASFFAGGACQLKPSAAAGTWPMWPYGFPFGHVSGATQHLWLTLFVAGRVNTTGNVTLKAIFDGISAGASTGMVTGEAQTSATWSASSGTYTERVAASIDLTTFCAGNQDAQVLSAIEVEIPGNASLWLALSLTVGAAAPTSWEEADVGSVELDFGAAFCAAYANGTGWESDEFAVDPVECVLVRRCEPTIDPEVGRQLDDEAEVRGVAQGMPPEDALYVAATLEPTGGPTPCVTVDLACYSVLEATGTNTTMRALPSFTSGGGAEVTIDGRTARVPSGTHTLTALVIPGGVFEVRARPYNTYDGLTLTWEGGAL